MQQMQHRRRALAPAALCRCCKRLRAAIVFVTITPVHRLTLMTVTTPEVKHTPIMQDSSASVAAPCPSIAIGVLRLLHCACSVCNPQQVT
ncbi:hypothetical protein COO60DRAFT_76714 [Scenedesmus sp. NREL 46B-D3]|nr:hypothetical protein COO60DRAFT_76714 [Scenedesmus sp. NREL 46B-D3]